jgi:ferric-dicitrate binding protein FerR (iron transport regulator)
MAGDGRHHPKVKTADGGGSNQMLIVGGLIAVIGGSAIWYLNRAGDESKLNPLFNAAEARKVSTNNGQRGDMTLSDGTKMTIGPATKLTIIPDYNTTFRGVKVDGTVAFDVKASPGVPLEVRTAGAAVVIDEGAMVVRGYADEADAYINLTAGKASVRGKGERREITAPAAVRIGKDSTVTDADPAAATLATSWATGTVSIKDMPLKDVLPLFTKYYAITMEAADPALLTRPVTMDAQLDSKQKAIDALAASAFVKFGYDGNKPILRDDPAAAAKAAKAAPKP